MWKKFAVDKGQISRYTYNRERQLVSFRFENRLPVPAELAKFMGPTCVLSVPDGPHEPCYEGEHRY